MAEYWIKTDAEAAAQGPYRSADLKSFAAAGQIEKQWLVSVDQQKWVPAGRVNGLIFPAAPAAASEPVAADEEPFAEREPLADAWDGGSAPAVEAVAADQSFGAASEAVALPVPALNYAGPASAALAGYGGPPGKIRNLKWMTISAIALAGLTVVAAGLSAASVVPVAIVAAKNPNAASPPMSSAATLTIAFAGIAWDLVSLATLGILIYVLVWIYQVHEEMRIFTGGAYPISPGKALGFCFIPIFNLYWFVHMPGKLADGLQASLRDHPDAVRPGTIRTLQFLSILPGSCIPGLQLILLSVSFNKLQSSLNMLWVASGRPLP